MSNSIKFVKTGAKLSKYTNKIHCGLLHLTADWKLLSDLADKLVFPSFIAIICLRPDIIMLELTCPLQGKYGRVAPIEIL